MRIDKYLWTVRLFKTRNVAADACKSGKVLINETTLKPSREVKPGVEFQIKRPPLIYSYKIKEFPKSRVGAKLVPDYLEDLTPQEELNKLEHIKGGMQSIREKGSGRQTKKDRRTIDGYFD